MSQHDYVIENQTFPATRTDINNALGAVVSQNSGATAPSTTYAYQLWYDITANILKQRNADNDAWIDLFDVDQVADAATPSAGVGISGIVDNSTATAITIDSSNDITLSGGVYLGGTGSDNLLDDYEEGTWTPVASDATSGGNTASTSSSTGSYTKIGRLVTVSLDIADITTTGMGTGNFYIQGLPFTSGSSVGTASNIMLFNGITLLADETGGVGFQLLENTSYLRPVAMEDDGGIKNVLNSSQLTSGSAHISGLITYMT